MTDNIPEIAAFTDHPFTEHQDMDVSLSHLAAAHCMSAQ